MTKLLLALTVILSATAYAAEVPSMTFDTLILRKNTNDATGIIYVPNRHVKTWCAGMGSPMSIMSYEAAETMDKLTDGLYTCSGKFVQIPADRSFPIQIFQIDTCTEVNAAEMRAASCPIKK